MKTLYFTATGNSLYAARMIGGELMSIPGLMRQDTIEIKDDAVGIVCPTYATDLPKMVYRFLEKAKIRTDYFFIVMTYGASCSVSDVNMDAIARKCGLELSYYRSVLMVDNYLPFFEMNDQKEGAGKKEIDRQLKKVHRDIFERRIRRPNILFFRRPAGAIMHGAATNFILKGNSARSYIVTDACVHCGICAKVCPADNIEVTPDTVKFQDHCEVCYACIHNCPENAIHLKKEKSAARFRNEHVTLEEIIKANGGGQ